MKGYNLPDNVSPSDPEAPWDEEEKDEEEHPCKGYEVNAEGDPCAWLLYSGRCGRPGFDLTRCKY